MPGIRYFLGLGGSFLLGAAVIIIALIAGFLLLPYMMPMLIAWFPYLAGAFVVVAAFMVVFIVVYFIAFLGTLFRYLFKPAEVSKEAKGYAVSVVKEAGLRGKGGSKGGPRKKNIARRR